MSRGFIFVAAVSWMLAFSALPSDVLAKQFAARSNQETPQKKISSRNSFATPAGEFAQVNANNGYTRSHRDEARSANPLKPMIERVEARPQPTTPAAPAVTNAAAQSVANRFSLQTIVTAPRQTMIKQPTRIGISVKNDGAALTDPAALVVWLPENTQLHSSDPLLTRRDDGAYTIVIAGVAEKSKRDYSLEVISSTPEPIRVRTQIQMLASQEIGIQVGRPELGINVAAPELSFQNADNLYSFDVRNESPVELTRVRIVAAVPEGLQVTTLNRAATIDSQNRTMTWELARLKGKGQESFQFRAIALHPGAQCGQITATSSETDACAVSYTTMIDARADLKIGVNPQGGPIPLKQTATVEIRIENRGTERARNVEIEMSIPAALQALPADAYRIDDGRLVFPAVDLEMGETRTFPIQFVASEAGEHVLRAQIKSQSQRSIATEDRVFVYDASAPSAGPAQTRVPREIK